MFLKKNLNTSTQNLKQALALGGEEARCRYLLGRGNGGGGGDVED